MAENIVHAKHLLTYTDEVGTVTAYNGLNVNKMLQK